MNTNTIIEHRWNDTGKNRKIRRLKFTSTIAYLKIQFLPRSKHTWIRKSDLSLPYVLGRNALCSEIRKRHPHALYGQNG
jgi:hypothetical protein